LALALLSVLLSASAEPTRIVALGDPRGSTTTAYVNTNVLGNIVTSVLALDPKPDAVVVHGDMIFSPVNIDNGYLQFTNIMQRLVTNGIPYYCALGNHEVGSGWYTKWQDAFDFPQNGPEQWKELVYYADIGCIRLVVLDSITGGTNWVAGLRLRIDGEQLVWLQSVIGTNSPAVFDVLTSHIPAYSASVAHANGCLDLWPVERDAFLQATVDARSTLYFAGHEHMFYRRNMDTRYNPNWTHTVTHIVNCSGAPFHNELITNTILPEIWNYSDYAFTVVDVDPDSGRGTATTYTEDGSRVIDRVDLIGKNLPLIVTFKSTLLAEGMGTLPDHGLVTAPYTATSNLPVTLWLDDPSEATVTNTVIIPAGTNRVAFDVTPLNDTEYDGPQMVLVHARAAGFADGTASVEIADTGGGEATLVSTGSVWRYLDDGSDQGTMWQDPGFNDNSWSNGQAQLGYGDGDEATTVSYGSNVSNKHATTYFRHSFDLPRPFYPSSLLLSLIRDDGAVVYLNGAEALRTNMPAGAIDYSTLALSPIFGAEEQRLLRTDLDPGLLTNGTNVIAVEIHQVSPEDPDISFDLGLSAVVLPRLSFAATTTVERYCLSYSNTALLGETTEDFSSCCLMPSTGELLVPARVWPRPWRYVIQTYDRNGAYMRLIYLDGFQDVEGICQYDPERNLFAVVEEGVNDISIIEINADTTNIIKSACTVIPMGIELADVNRGIEGLSYDPANQCFYAVKESTPMAIYRITWSGAVVSVTEPFDAQQVFGGICGDLSDLVYDPYSGHLFILSDLGNLVLECDLAGNILSTLSIAGNQPEGIALSADGGELHIISEPNEYFRYALPVFTNSGSELDSTAVIDVMLSSPMATTVTVQYVVTSQTAVVNEDYSPDSGLIVFEPGSTRETIQISILSDPEKEADETLLVILTNASGAWIPADASRAHTIIADAVELVVVSTYGNTLPPVGTNLLAYDSLLTCSVIDSPALAGIGTRYFCTGWSATGDIPSPGSGTNTSSFVLTTNSTITWNWGQPQYWLGSIATGSGTISNGNAWVEPGTSITLQASCSAFRLFGGWSGDVSGGNTNSLTYEVTMDQPRTLIATFIDELATNNTPLWWLDMHYPGTNDFDAAALSDTDNDGMYSWQEYVAGTDPTNPASVFRLISVTLDGPGETVSWYGVTGKTYAVYGSTNLADGWLISPLISDVPGSVLGTNSFTQSQSNMLFFYRVKLH
jgi:hypothetical protein